MQEMIELAKSQGTDTPPQAVSYQSEGSHVVLSAGPAHFGKQLSTADKVESQCCLYKHFLNLFFEWYYCYLTFFLLLFTS